VLKDDGWEAERGFTFIRNLVEGEKVFGLAVVPSSEGLRVASTQRYLRQRGVPVIGTDGMLISQYTDPMVWPVAASTITAMHVMAQDASQRGRKNFAIVYDSNFRFGVEGAYAYNQAVKRLTGSDVPGYSDPLSAPRCRERFCGIKAGQPSYQTELQVFKSACSGGCDYVMYLLEPQTAQTWMEGGGPQAGSGLDIAGPQPLFNRSFGSTCGAKCHGMWVWTGFLPPVGRFASEAAVARYVSDVHQANAQADTDNSFVLGGYLGMKLLVEALRAVGPDLTRERMVAALDAITLDTGLSKPLSWRPGNHFANQCMMAYSIQSRPQFAGWRQETDFVCDPWPGEDIPASER
jgi:ABC-type branched-subunit amino acid transport system substrate-binding protein